MQKRLDVQNNKTGMYWTIFFGGPSQLTIEEIPDFIAGSISSNAWGEPGDYDYEIVEVDADYLMHFEYIRALRAQLKALTPQQLNRRIRNASGRKQMLIDILTLLLGSEHCVPDHIGFNILGDDYSDQSGGNSGGDNDDDDNDDNGDD